MHISASVEYTLPIEKWSMASNKLISEDFRCGHKIKVHTKPPSATRVRSFNS